uniref:Uncharacterized protein n=1 Tax=Romanomermis culicivorax TaxID=13658 RepID=A0A915L7L8_ROMCU
MSENDSSNILKCSKIKFQTMYNSTKLEACERFLGDAGAELSLAKASSIRLDFPFLPSFAPPATVTQTSVGRY